jgi:hypothetical protein
MFLAVHSTINCSLSFIVTFVAHSQPIFNSVLASSSLLVWELEMNVFLWVLVAHSFNPSYSEGGSRFEASLGR